MLLEFCGDFKPLNRYLIVDQHPIPLPSDLFSVLIDGKYFTNLDLSDAYYQLRVDEDS